MGGQPPLGVGVLVNGGVVRGVGVWILPQHDPHTYLMENRIA